MPIVILQVYDRILPNQAIETLLLLALGLLVVILLDALCRGLRSYITGWNAARFEHLAACRAVERILAGRISDLEAEAPGVHLDRLTAVGTLRDFHAGQAKLLMIDLPFVSLFLGLVFVIGGSLVLVPLVLFALLGLTSLLIGRILREALSERAALDDRRYNFAIEVLGGLHTIKLLAMEAFMERRYERLQEGAAAATYEVTFAGNLAQMLGWFFSNLTMVAVGALGASQVMEGSLSIGGLAACTLLSGRSVQPVLRALGLWAQYQGITIAQRRFDEIFAATPECESRAARPAPSRGDIELDEVSFRYGDDSPLLLDRVSLRIAAGETLSISGESGSGKSTFLLLLMGLLRPSGGEIRVGGQALTAIDQAAWRRTVAFMPQAAVLFQGTILENLTLFRETMVLEEALEAGRLLGVDQSVRRLPDGYQTKVGDGAEMELPVGLRQGIGMARALAGRPRVILFDEANGGLDGAADQALKDALLR